MSTQNTQNRIIDAAVSLFNSEGASSVSLSRIAEEAGIGKGNLHYHYHYSSGEEIVMEYDEVNCVYDAFRHSATRYTGHDFLHIPRSATSSYSSNALDISYGDAAARVEQQKLLYQNAGYGCGHRVALILQNRLEFFVHWLALNALGCSVVPINDEMAADEQAYIIDHSEAILLVYLADLGSSVEPLRALLSDQLRYLPLAQDTPQIPIPTAQASGEAISVHSECALLYTSGSTGKPKGCILSNEYYLLSGQRYVDLGGLCTLQEGAERLITPLPLVHMNAMACSTVAMILIGGCIVQLDRFHPSSWWQSVRESRATVAHYLGVMPAMLLNAAPGDDDFSGQIKFAFGAGVNPRHHAAFEQRFGFPLIEAWGMTETGNYGAIIAIKEPRHIGTCCFGEPPEHLDFKLVDEQNQSVPVGNPGELLIRHRGDNRTKGFFDGYLKNPLATDEAWEDGWFHTGDVVRQDSDGTMCFVDRRKNVIRRSGENISALEVEAALSENPCIAQAVVCPVPDEIRGEEVMACIILAPGSLASAQAAESIVIGVLELLSYFKVPGYVYFSEELPLTASGKPRRADIKALAQQSLSDDACVDTRSLKKRKQVSLL